MVVTGALYGGIQYSQGKDFGFGFLGDKFAQMMQQMPNRSERNNGMMNQENMEKKANVGLTSGEIIAKDDQSVTIKARDGSTRKVLFDDSTKVTRSMMASLEDLMRGEMVTVVGKVNEEGSVEASAIQIKP